MDEVLKNEQLRRRKDLLVFLAGFSLSVCIQALGVFTQNIIVFLAGLGCLVVTMVFMSSNHIIRMLELDHSVIIKQNELLDARMQMIETLLTNNTAILASKLKTKRWELIKK